MSGWSTECFIFPNGGGMKGKEKSTEGKSGVCSHREKTGGVQSRGTSILLCPWVYGNAHVSASGVVISRSP